MKRRAILLLLSGTLTIAAAVTAQIPSDPNLVYVHVTATTSDGRYVTGLQKESFTIFEDNVAQNIAFFSGVDLPVTVALLVDANGDTNDQVVAAWAELLQYHVPGDEFFVADAGPVPLNDAISQALNQLLQRKNSRRALVVFTASNDPARYAYAKVKELLRQHDIRLYVIAIPERTDISADSGQSLLKELAEGSGGRSYFPQSRRSLQSIFYGLGLEMKNQYLIGYRPTNSAADGKWRKIKVTAQHVVANQPVRPVTVRAKQGYYAPTVSGPGR